MGGPVTEYELISIEDAVGERIGWRLMEDVGVPRWEQVATIGALTTEDARDWAAGWITSEDQVTWKSDDGTVFASRWRASVADPWDDEEG